MAVGVRDPVTGLFSEAWFDALEASLGSLGSLGPLPADEPAGAASGLGPALGLALGQIVTGVPDVGEVRYLINLAGNGPGSLVRGSVGGADVTLVEDWETAEAIASGEASVPDLLTNGRIKIRGDARRLVDAAPLLARVTPLLGGGAG